MAKKSMKVLEQAKAKAWAKHERMYSAIRKAETRYEKALVRYELAKIARDEMYDRRHKISEKIAGINGHLQYTEWGATKYEVSGEYIRFFDDDGNEVRNPRYPKVIE